MVSRDCGGYDCIPVLHAARQVPGRGSTLSSSHEFRFVKRNELAPNIRLKKAYASSLSQLI